jgi:hypothetical protein
MTAFIPVRAEISLMPSLQFMILKFYFPFKNNIYFQFLRKLTSEGPSYNRNEKINNQFIRGFSPKPHSNLSHNLICTNFLTMKFVINFPYLTGRGASSLTRQSAVM